jgi:2',3'-cyclic-nucleotide 2'-phosphodiesterase (5'-nucleotidase family)
MAQFKYDAVAFGEREMKFGGNEYLAEIQKRKLPLLAANLRRVEGEKRFTVGPPFIVKEYDGVKVGIFSVIGAEAYAASPQADPNYTIDDPFQMAADLVPQIRKKADIVVMFAHMPSSDALTLLQQVKGIDVALFAHGPGVQPKPVMQGETIVVRPGERGQNAGILRISVAPDGTVAEFDGEVVTLGEKYPANPEVQKDITAIKADLARIAKEDDVARKSAMDEAQAVDRFIGDQKCGRCHVQAMDAWKASGHARALQTLVDLQMNDSPECLRCHVTGFGQPTGFRAGKTEPDLSNVQCESCHDLGTKHDRAHAQPVTEALCVGCHDAQNSPGFDYHSALKKIAH